MNSFEKDWRFTRNSGKGFESAELDDSSWEKIDIPHDWAIAGPFSPDHDSEVIVDDPIRGRFSLTQDAPADSPMSERDFTGNILN